MRSRPAGEEGVALVTVLVLVVVLTVMGVAMVDLALTEIGLSYGQGDAAGAQYIAEAGLARALYGLGGDAGWTGATEVLGTGDDQGQYQVTVTSSGTARFIESIGTRGGGRRVLHAAVKVIPRFALYGVLGNTTVSLGSGQSGLGVENAFPSDAAGAVHANNRLAAATAVTINPAGATVSGPVTANGAVSGIICPTSLPWPCDPAAGVLRFPRLDLDSADAASYRNRAMNTIDPVDGKNLYFHGGDATSRCNSGGGWTFGNKETQRCWDRYVNDRGGTIGAVIPNAVFYVQFNPNERTQYTLSTQTTTHRRSRGGDNGGGANTLTINRPAGVVLDDVMVAAIAVRGGSNTTITSVPAGWNLVPGGTNPIDNGTTLKMAVYYKVATGAEPGSYTWGFSSSQKASGGIQAYSNVDTGAPIDVALGQAATTNASGQISTPTITTTLDGTMLIASFALAQTTGITPPAGMTERYEANSTGGATSSRTDSEGSDQLQAVSGATGVKTMSSGLGAGVAGVAHLLALAPRRVTVDCVGLAATTAETLCLRSRPATDSSGTILYASSRIDQVSGMIAAFRRVAGTAVAGDVAFENLSLRTAAYAHLTPAGDPALVAAGQLRIVSTGAASGPQTVDLTGIIYTFAGLDNPGGGCVPPSTCTNDLQGSAGPGITIQHGADLVDVTLAGFVMSNGTVVIEDSAANSGSITVQYDAVATDVLPQAFMPAATGNVLLPLSWSGKD